MNNEKAKALLATNGLNRTKTKTSILVALSSSYSPLSATEIHQQLGDTCNISTVFRTIGQFKEKGMIKELNLGEDFFRYEIGTIDPLKSHHHHHHVRCRLCGEIKLVDKCDMSIFENMISKLGYHKMEHYLEFTGICNKCNQE